MSNVNINVNIENLLINFGGEPPMCVPDMYACGMDICPDCCDEENEFPPEILTLMEHLGVSPEDVTVCPIRGKDSECDNVDLLHFLNEVGQKFEQYRDGMESCAVVGDKPEAEVRFYFKESFDPISEFHEFEQKVASLVNLANERGVDFTDDSMVDLIKSVWDNHALSQLVYDENQKQEVLDMLGVGEPPIDFILSVANHYIERNSPTNDAELDFDPSLYFTEHDFKEAESRWGKCEVSNEQPQVKVFKVSPLFGATSQSFDPSRIAFGGGILRL